MLITFGFNHLVLAADKSQQSESNNSGFKTHKSQEPCVMALNIDKRPGAWLWPGAMQTNLWGSNWDTVWYVELWSYIWNPPKSNTADSFMWVCAEMEWEHIKSSSCSCCCCCCLFPFLFSDDLAFLCPTSLIPIQHCSLLTYLFSSISFQSMPAHLADP